MKTLQELLIILVGFSIIYIIFDTLISSQRLKQYCTFFVGLCLLAVSITTLSEGINISLNIPSLDIPDTNTSSTMDDIWLSSEEGIKHSAKMILNESFPDIKFSVSAHKTPQGTIFIYVGINKTDDELKIEILNLLSKKIGISTANVNIYLTNDKPTEGNNGECNDQEIKT